MSQTCPNCGAVNRATNRFCSNCGAMLAKAANQENSQPGAQASAAPAADAGLFSPPPPDPGSSSTSQAPTSYAVQRWEPDPNSQPYGGASQQPPAFIPPPPAPPTSVGTSPYTGYQGYSPSASNRQMSAALAPYSTDVAAGLEQPKSQRSWLIPVIAAAVLVLLVLAAVSAYLVLTNSNKTTGTTTQVPQTSPGITITPLPANASEEDKVKQVIAQSNNEQIQAWQTLDTNVLSGTRTGTVLSDNIKMVQDLEAQGIYAIPVNSRLDIRDVKVNGNTATAHTFEIWNVTYYDKKTNQPVQSTGPDQLYETYHLVKQNGKWLINQLDIYGPGTPTPTGD